MQNAAFFAGAHDVDVHLAEYLRMGLHGLSQTAPLLDVLQQLQHQLAHGCRFRDAVQQTQGLV